MQSALFFSHRCTRIFTDEYEKVFFTLRKCFKIQFRRRTAKIQFPLRRENSPYLQICLRFHSLMEYEFARP